MKLHDVFVSSDGDISLVDQVSAFQLVDGFPSSRNIQSVVSDDWSGVVTSG